MTQKEGWGGTRCLRNVPITHCGKDVVFYLYRSTIVNAELECIVRHIVKYTVADNHFPLRLTIDRGLLRLLLVGNHYPR